MNVGDRIRVKENIVVYHHPQHRNQPFSLQGLEGEAVEIMVDWKGRSISPNFPVKVKFERRFQAHLSPKEIEVLNWIWIKIEVQRQKY